MHGAAGRHHVGHEVGVISGAPGERDPHVLPNSAARAVGAAQVGGQVRHCRRVVAGDGGDDPGVGVGHVHQLGVPLHVDAGGVELLFEHLLVIVLRVAQDERVGAGAGAEVLHVQPGRDAPVLPHHDVLDLHPAVHDLVGEPELPVELQRPGLDAQGT